MKRGQVNTDVMVLGAAHALMVSNVPEVVVEGHSLSEHFFHAAANFGEGGKVKESVEKFGLFGGSLNVNSFMPNVTAEMLKPKAEDFIEPMFRLLSATIVAKKYNPTEFSEAVLKESMHLLLGQSVNCDHDTDVGNAVGAVSAVEWQESYKENGIVIPAGINGVLKIDGLSNPRLARGIMMDPPSIHSNSVTVEFAWEPSHQFEDIWEFYSKLGTYNEKGEMIRRIVTKIISYKETSLVWHGADPFAQLLKSGRLNNPAYAGSQYYSFSEEQAAEANEPSKRVAMYDFKSFSEKLPKYNTTQFNNEKGSGNGNHTNQSNKQNMNKELQQLLESLFGENLLTLAEGHEASAQEALTQIKNLVQQNKDLTTSKGNLEAEVSTLKEEKANLEKEVAKFKLGHEAWAEHVKSFREATVAQYRKVMGEENVDQNILQLLEGENTTFETLAALRKTYDAQLEEKFPMHCAVCGSHDISRASSVAEDKNGEGAEGADNKPRDTASVAARLAESKLRGKKE